MHIFTFYKTDNIIDCIHISAMSFLEAVNALSELDPYANIHYNLREYNVVNIYDYNKFIKLTNIDIFYINHPYFLSDKLYKELTKKDYKKVIDKSEVKNKINQKIEEIIKHPKYNTFIPSKDDV